MKMEKKAQIDPQLQERIEHFIDELEKIKPLRRYFLLNQIAMPIVFLVACFDVDERGSFTIISLGILVIWLIALGAGRWFQRSIFSECILIHCTFIDQILKIEKERDEWERLLNTVKNADPHFLLPRIDACEEAIRAYDLAYEAFYKAYCEAEKLFGHYYELDRILEFPSPIFFISPKGSNFKKVKKQEKNQTFFFLLSK